MPDMLHLMAPSLADIQTFRANANASGVGWQTWLKPRGCSMVSIIAIGAGGNGGNGAVGANSTAAGGGGGGSGSQSAVTIPAAFLPDSLFVSVGYGGTDAQTLVCVDPQNTAMAILARANGGGSGGNASGATAGAVGTAGAVATLAQMPLAGLGQYTLLAGQAGIIGGVAVAGANLTVPATGLTVSGGAGGGGLPAAATSGTAGGSITGSANIIPSLPGGAAQATATSPGNNGSNGMDFAFRGLAFCLGGAGGGSSHGTATGAGLKGGGGGKGGIGSGGGGGGGCLTGGTAGIGGKGGDGEVTIIAW